jgi:hypothetical protein
MSKRIVLGLAAFGLVLSGPALGDCAADIVKTRHQLDRLPAYVSTKLKQDVANHLAWAERALRIKSESDCLEHVKKARALLAR